ASAVLAALCVAGLPTDRFFFNGFLPPKSAARKAALRDLSTVPGTLIFYESPKRLQAMLRDAAEVLGPRDAAVCRELTKKFEEVRKAPLDALAESYAANDPKGEIVVLIDRAATQAIDEDTIRAALRIALREGSLKSAAKDVSDSYGIARNMAYQMALAIKDET
ncbi:MAG: SAM-dependent methyltransferase, partial [Jannaschia helgolandensis]